MSKQAIDAQQPPTWARRHTAATFARRLAAAAAIVAVTLAVTHARAAGAGGARPNTVAVQRSSQQVTPPVSRNPNTPAEGAANAAAQSGPAAPAATPPAATATDGREKSRAILQAWQAKHPERSWDATPAHAAKASPVPGGEQRQTYGAFTERDEALWAASYQRFVDRGKAIFHSGELLGTTVGISCDMCHPDGANTHPETYPKYQVQLGRVAMLRDMVNWCLQNPVRAKPLADEDERLKALEAYITATRAGREMMPGKH